MSEKEIAFKIEELQIQAEKADGLQNALWQAIYCGDFNASVYEWAFVLLGDITCELKNELEILSRAAFNALHEKKG